LLDWFGAVPSTVHPTPQSPAHNLLSFNHPERFRTDITIVSLTFSQMKKDMLGEKHERRKE
jgi:hypothetical protein